MKMENETRWDRLLRIKTSGRDDSRADRFRYPYEPTPYCVLERLADSGYIGKENTLIDYGCGKGRVDFFLSYQTRCRSIGIDYDDRILNAAKENQRNAVSAGRTEFLLQDAAGYEVPKEADRFYFFNPFSIEIFRGVLQKIIDSYYESPREMLLFSYYTQNYYFFHLEARNELTFLEAIDCRDLFGSSDHREKIRIYKIG